MISCGKSSWIFPMCFKDNGLLGFRLRNLNAINYILQLYAFIYRKPTSIFPISFGKPETGKIKMKGIDFHTLLVG